MVIHEAASLRMYRKLNFTRINICNFHRHRKLVKFSSSQIFPAVQYAHVGWVMINVLF